MPKTISQTVDEIIGSLRSVCCCPSEQWQALRGQLMAIFLRYNQPDLASEELAAAKNELETTVRQFRSKYQRIFEYQDPFGF